MAARRALFQLSSRTLAISAPKEPIRHSLRVLGKESTRCLRTATIAACRTSSQVQRIEQRRWHSTPSEVQKPKVYNFEDIQSLSSSPSPSRILIDVREPAELSASGTIPTAINIPVTSQPDALALPPDEFYDRFGFDKPSPEAEVVFYCKAGVRSSAAAQLALQNGYEKVGNYRGSWLDWEKRGGRKEAV
ncbi:Rhodanese-like protein [Rhizodiscina lignyota]|uniref:Rhodanese-like protein n=1 Tax=Rhizodiscina lignyota TaxID=1504668 RepID=A0A9P4IL67_9PEZI|nr:Rhodanese-like protein [Rhizodiscina lignyota]